MSGDDELVALLADVELAAAVRELDAVAAILAAYAAERADDGPTS